ncbi:hypothetical protein NGR_c06330 [Sinorhizobium fredii NGR234]|uniref:Uncharacterized protein n=1 Tax=Sinorhizobium fredii (strain NBRC 101917 / NGR234) TaxID=394 RepID=C3MI78_SINFN|nr:hypothetical protein NGR_c06330 [Sinorhizobium fredii NGR234]
MRRAFLLSSWSTTICILVEFAQLPFRSEAICRSKPYSDRRENPRGRVLLRKGLRRLLSTKFLTAVRLPVCLTMV